MKKSIVCSIIAPFALISLSSLADQSGTGAAGGASKGTHVQGSTAPVSASRDSGNGVVGGANAGKPSMKGDDHAALFQALDLNSDRKLSRDEFLKIHSTALNNIPKKEADRAALFLRLDADKDGFLSLEEFQGISDALNGKPAPTSK